MIIIFDTDKRMRRCIIKDDPYSEELSFFKFNLFPNYPENLKQKMMEKIEIPNINCMNKFTLECLSQVNKRFIIRNSNDDFKIFQILKDIARGESLSKELISGIITLKPPFSNPNENLFENDQGKFSNYISRSLASLVPKNL